MAVPNSRESLKDYCLRKLGYPVIEINIAEDQIEDSIDDAIDYFQEYHLDGTERQFIAIKITQTDIDNKYVILDDKVVSVMKVYNYANSADSTTALFSATYQIRLNELWDMSSGTMSQFVISQQYVALLNDTLNPETRFRFRRHTHKLELDLSWAVKLDVDNYILVEVYQNIDPEEYNEIYGNWLLRKLATAYMRRQWGYNLIKFAEIKLPGQVSLNGERILNEANKEIEQLELDFITKYSEPLEFFIE